MLAAVVYMFAMFAFRCLQCSHACSTRARAPDFSNDLVVDGTVPGIYTKYFMLTSSVAQLLYVRRDIGCLEHGLLVYLEFFAGLIPAFATSTWDRARGLEEVGHAHVSAFCIQLLEYTIFNCVL